MGRAWASLMSSLPEGPKESFSSDLIEKLNLFNQTLAFVLLASSLKNLTDSYFMSHKILKVFFKKIEPWLSH